MRNIKELLELVRDQIVNKRYMDRGHWGLCSVVAYLYNRQTINGDEYYMLSDYIDNHKPFLYYFRKFSTFPGHYWTPGKARPRLRWLNKHIKKLS